MVGRSAALFREVEDPELAKKQSLTEPAKIGAITPSLVTG
jgi:hypothetical protein